MFTKHQSFHFILLQFVNLYRMISTNLIFNRCWNWCKKTNQIKCVIIFIVIVLKITILNLYFSFEKHEYRKHCRFGWYFFRNWRFWSISNSDKCYNYSFEHFDRCNFYGLYHFGKFVGLSVSEFTELWWTVSNQM